MTPRSRTIWSIVFCTISAAGFTVGCGGWFLMVRAESAPLHPLFWLVLFLAWFVVILTLRFSASRCR